MPLGIADKLAGMSPSKAGTRIRATSPTNQSMSDHPASDGQYANTQAYPGVAV